MMFKVASTLREVIPLCLAVFFIGPRARVRGWVPVTTRKLTKTTADHFITSNRQFDSLSCLA